MGGYERMGPKIKEAKAKGLNQREAIEELLGKSSKCSELLVKMKSNELKLPKKHIVETYTCGGSDGPAPAPPPSPSPAAEVTTTQSVDHHHGPAPAPPPSGRAGEEACE